MVSKAAQSLAKHQAESYPGVYYIERHGSFREQMTEAVVFVRSAFIEKVFRENSTLLVIGGGVSGLAAGLEAAKRGMLVTLLESKPILLSVQRNCHTRFLHPHEYKWPRDHHTETVFPFLNHEKLLCPWPLRWKAGIASEVAKKIAAQVESEAPSNLILTPNFRHIPISLNTLRSSFDPNGDFDFILICAGAEEKTHLGNFQGVRYWENDLLENLSYLPKKRKIKKVVISGGGDGGLQDFLRIIHCPQKTKLFSAGRFLKQLLPKLEQSLPFVNWIRKKKKYTKSHRPPPPKLWRDFNNLLDLMEQDHVNWKTISRALLNRIDGAILRQERRVQLLFKDSTFSDAYSLNAFLVLLVTRVMSDRQLLRPNCKLHEITSSSPRHHCVRNAKKCCGRRHRILLKDINQSKKETEDADIIVIRHGSKQALLKPQK